MAWLVVITSELSGAKSAMMVTSSPGVSGMGVLNSKMLETAMFVNTMAFVNMGMVLLAETCARAGIVQAASRVAARRVRWMNFMGWIRVFFGGGGGSNSAQGETDHRGRAGLFDDHGPIEEVPLVKAINRLPGAHGPNRRPTLADAEAFEGRGIEHGGIGHADVNQHFPIQDARLGLRGLAQAGGVLDYVGHVQADREEQVLVQLIQVDGTVLHVLIARLDLGVRAQGAPRRHVHVDVHEVRGAGVLGER